MIVPTPSYGHKDPPAVADGVALKLSPLRRETKTPVRLLVAVAVLAAAMLSVVGTERLIFGRYPHAGGCGEGPTNPAVTAESYPDSFKYPYGDVTSCRELYRESHPF